VAPPAVKQPPSSTPPTISPEGPLSRQPCKTYLNEKRVDSCSAQEGTHAEDQTSLQIEMPNAEEGETGSEGELAQLIAVMTASFVIASLVALK